MPGGYATFLSVIQYCAKVMRANFDEFRRISTNIGENQRYLEGNESSSKFRRNSKRYCLDMFEISPDCAKHRAKFRTIFFWLKRIFERGFLSRIYVKFCEFSFAALTICYKFRFTLIARFKKQTSLMRDAWIILHTKSFARWVINFGGGVNITFFRFLLIFSNFRNSSCDL